MYRTHISSMTETCHENKPTKPLLSYLDLPQHRGTVCRSASCMLQTTTGFAVWSWLVARYTSSLSDGGLVPALVSAMWAMLVLRSYMIFHDCGHGSFFQGGGAWTRALNRVSLEVSAVMCATPTDWNVGHALHHSNVGRLGQDDYSWGETVFHTRSEYVRLSAWKRLAWRVIRHPVPFFALAPILTWYFKMRLPFELRPDRKAAYRCRNKMTSLAWAVCRYGLAARWSVLSIVLVGDYLAMLVGVILFHLQHVYRTGYVRTSDEWTRKDAALLGSSFLAVPRCLKWCTLGIEYHHIHHFRTNIPGYMLQSVHDGAPHGSWDDVVVLRRPWGVWTSLTLTVYDDVVREYATFSEVMRRHRCREKRRVE